jgi:cyclo(L-tyrosyl-L-tyrosyl) synthase
MDSRIDQTVLENGRISVEPISLQSRNIRDRGEHVVLGISPFNAYFTEERIRELAAWGRQHFKAMHLFVPDVPSIFTLRAMGYTESRARKKAHRQAKYLVNKIHSALEALGFPAKSTDEIILTWEKLASNPRYQALLQQAKDIYCTDGEFQHDCRSEVLRVLKNRSEPPETISPDALDVVAEYFLCEMPLFVDTPTILAQNSSIFAYRECIPLLCKLFLGEYRFRASDQQGFVVVKSAFETEAKSPMFEGMFV